MGDQVLSLSLNHSTVIYIKMSGTEAMTKKYSKRKKASALHIIKLGLENISVHFVIVSRYLLKGDDG